MASRSEYSKKRTYSRSTGVKESNPEQGIAGLEATIVGKIGVHRLKLVCKIRRFRNRLLR